MPAPVSFTVRPPNSAPYRPSPLGNRGPPSRRLFSDDQEDEDEDDDHHLRGKRSERPREERIEGFGKNGRAIGGDKPEAPLVIPAIPNRDWRASSTRKTPTYRPETRPQVEVDDTHERVGDGPQRSGLRQIKKEVKEDEDGSVSVKLEKHEESSNGSVKVEVKEEVEVKREPLTLEEQALQALLQGEVSRETEEERLRRELVISSAKDTPFSEEDALKRDVNALPIESTIDDYAAVPVSAFGEAMARGMGWTPAAEGGTKIHEPKSRPALLGLGATAMQAPVPPSRSGSSNGKKPRPPSKRDAMKYSLAGAMVRRDGSETPGASSASEDSEGKRRRDDDDGRESKRRDDGYRDRDRDSGRDRARDRDEDRYRERRSDYRDSGRYETEDERARRKAKERESRDRGDERSRYRDSDRRDDRGRYRDRDDRDRREDRDRRDRDRDRRR
ncbi:hypothetical protein IAR50_000162 [Cryptococcus sp. DSM 104548]